MNLITVKIQKPDNINFILGQSHFIKTVEDIHETLVTCVPGIKFGLAFCEFLREMPGPLVRDRSHYGRPGSKKCDGDFCRS